MSGRLLWGARRLATADGLDTAPDSILPTYRGVFPTRSAAPTKDVRPAVSEATAPGLSPDLTGKAGLARRIGLAMKNGSAKRWQGTDSPGWPPNASRGRLQFVRAQCDRIRCDRKHWQTSRKWTSSWHPWQTLPCTVCGLRGQKVTRARIRETVFKNSFCARFPFKFDATPEKSQAMAYPIDVGRGKKVRAKFRSFFRNGLGKHYSGGRPSDPHCLFGCGPIVNVSVPPFFNTS